MSIPTVKLCAAYGCKGAVVARGYCDLHYRRLKLHGTLDASRPADWGERREHPLYGYWKQVRRNWLPICESWHNDFLAFVAGVGERPSAAHTIYRPDQNAPVGPGNAAWATSKAGPARDVAHLGKRVNKTAYMRQYMADRRAADPLHDLRLGLLKAHGISLDDYERLLAAQGGVCAICGREEPRHSTSGARRYRLAVDHRHGTTEVRGLLCSMCNHAIGYLDDSPELLRRAIAYLADPPAVGLGLEHSGKSKTRRREREASPFVSGSALACAAARPRAITAPSGAIRRWAAWGRLATPFGKGSDDGGTEGRPRSRAQDGGGARAPSPPPPRRRGRQGAWQEGRAQGRRARVA